MGRGQGFVYSVIAVVVILPLLLFGALQGAFLMQSAQARIEADALLRARTVNATVDGLVSADESALRVLTTSQFFVSRDLEGARARVLAVQATRSRWQDVILTDTLSRRVIWETRPADRPAQAPEWILRQLDQPAPSPFGGMVTEGEGCPCVAVHSPVLENGKTRYLLSLKLATDDFQKSLIGQSPPEAISAIVDRSGRFMARTKDYRARLATLSTPYVRNAIHASEGGTYAGVTFEGFRNYTAFETSRLTGWSTHIAVSESLVAGPRRASLLLTVAAAICAITLGLVLAWFLWRQLEQRRREATREAQAEKLTAIGELASGLSHDFNNLLTVIVTSAEFLRKADLPEGRRLRYVDAISDAASRAAGLTGQLLAFARRQPLRPVVFDVSRQIERAAGLVQPMVGERIALRIEAPSSPCYTRADIDQFQSALLNLASNARDAMSGQGKLTLSLSKAVSIPAMRSHPARSGDFVVLTVADTGVGIDAKRLQKIFEPFVTSKPVGEGTGLGLSQVQGFAQQSGGDITVESTLGVGTQFKLYLPACAADDTSSAPEKSTAPAFSSRRSLRILVVEDNDTVGQFSTEMLHDLGFKTTWVADGREALSLLESNSDRFDLVLSDVVMPGMTGIELARAIRERHPKIAILLASGYSGVTDMQALDGLELLAKPYTLEGLTQAIRRALDDRAEWTDPVR